LPKTIICGRISDAFSTKEARTDDKVSGDGNSQDNTIDPHDLKDTQPCISPSAMSSFDGRELDDSRDDCDHQISDVTLTLEKVPPIHYEADQYLNK
jgi:hypothetical protein